MRRRVCRLLTFTADVDGLARYRGLRFGFPSFWCYRTLLYAPVSDRTAMPARRP
jgi:hypothetical protein